MNLNLAEVFNTYNRNILFTVAALPSRVSLGIPLSLPIGGVPVNKQQLGNSSKPEQVQIAPQSTKQFQEEEFKQ